MKLVDQIIVAKPYFKIRKYIINGAQILTIKNEMAVLWISEAYFSKSTHLFHSSVVFYQLVYKIKLSVGDHDLIENPSIHSTNIYWNISHIYHCDIYITYISLF